MKKITMLGVFFGLVLSVSQAFADVPSSYDYEMFNGSLEHVIVNNVTLNKTLSFEYWYSGTTYPNLWNLGIVSVGGYNDENTKLGTVTIAQLPLSKISNQWVPVTIAVPSYVYLDPSGNPRTDMTGQTLDMQLSQFAAAPLYFKDIESSGGNSGGDHSSDGPAPEPATMMMLGTGLLGLAGFEIKRRKSVNR
jgi:hypothetical protein